jgi:hypothetical protein
MLLLALIVIGFAIARWRRHPTVSMITVAAFILYLIKIFVFVVLYYRLPTLRTSMHLSYAAIDNLSLLLGALNDIGFAIVIVMLVAAAFSKRQPVAQAL